jgi:hypothetical protein
LVPTVAATVLAAWAMTDTDAGLRLRRRRRIRKPHGAGQHQGLHLRARSCGVALLRRAAGLPTVVRTIIASADLARRGGAGGGGRIPSELAK